MKPALFLTALALFASPACATNPATSGPDVTLPAVIEFGAGVAAMQASLAPFCSSLERREMDVAELPVARLSHTQLDCAGFAHAGGERLAEFVFADDTLVFVWILTTAAEEGALTAALTGEFGVPTHALDGVFAWTDDHVALRRDTPELLYYSEAVAPQYRGWFDQMAQ